MTRLSGHGPGVLVAALSAAFGAALLTTTGFLGAAVSRDGVTGSSATVAAMLNALAIVFIAIAVYAGAVVTTNTFATIVAGRVREIALRRLLGARARDERRAVAREGLAIGLLGVLIGIPAGTGAAALGLALAQSYRVVPTTPYPVLQPVLLVPAVAVVLTTWLAAVAGSRRVLAVTPIQALGRAEEQSADEAGASRVRTVLAAIAVGAGGLLLAGGIVEGLRSPYGVLVALPGGILSFTGFVLGAHLVLPRALALVGRLLGGSPAARIAVANAARYPVRSTRSTVGIVVAVTLVTTFGVAIQSFVDLIHAAQAAQPEVYAGVDTMLTAVTTVFSVLIGFSALIAGIGLVNALSLGVLQRTRELGLLRALGFQARQVRAAIAAEGAQLVGTAVLVGLLLGVLYGWAGAQSLLGGIQGSPGVVLPGIPWGLVGIVVAAAAVLTLAASLPPARRATRVAPVDALGAD